jgi:hypothetical protein
MPAPLLWMLRSNRHNVERMPTRKAIIRPFGSQAIET